jgi:hypothetical protein
MVIGGFVGLDASDANAMEVWDDGTRLGADEMME